MISPLVVLCLAVLWLAPNGVVAYDGIVLNWEEKQVGSFLWSQDRQGEPAVRVEYFRDVDGSLVEKSVDGNTLRKSRPRGWYYIDRQMEELVEGGVYAPPPNRRKVFTLRIDGELAESVPTNGRVHPGDYSWIPITTGHPYAPFVRPKFNSGFPADSKPYMVEESDEENGNFFIGVTLHPEAAGSYDPVLILHPKLPPSVKEKFGYDGMVMAYRPHDEDPLWVDVGTFHWAGKPLQPDGEHNHNSSQQKIEVSCFSEEGEEEGGGGSGFSSAFVEKGRREEAHHGLRFLVSAPSPTSTACYAVHGSLVSIKPNGLLRLTTAPTRPTHRASSNAGDGRAGSNNRVVGEYRWIREGKVVANFDIEQTNTSLLSQQQLKLPAREHVYEVLGGGDFPPLQLGNGRNQWYFTVPLRDPYGHIWVILEPQLPPVYLE